jgi:ABC-2 type transport system ATP-binding protein
MPPILEANHLVKKYGEFLAVNDVSFAVEAGEVFGLLGPNGAGKSTTIAMLSGLFPPTEGTAQIGGLDVVKDRNRVKQLIGVVPQDLALYPTLTGRENVAFFGEMYGLHGKELRQRVDEVLGYVGMIERAGDPVKAYSGGMKRRINLAAGLVNRPRLLFLDEPTVGVDPQSRNHIFESVERLNRDHNMAILYTTHYMEEAERLCHRVGIIDRGRLIALDTPRRLIDRLGGGIIRVGVAVQDETLRQGIAALPAVAGAAWALSSATTANGSAADALGSSAGGEGSGSVQGAAASRPVLKVEAREGSDALVQVINFFNQRATPILSLEVLEPNLETVFLHLTGKSLRD